MSSLIPAAGAAWGYKLAGSDSLAIASVGDSRAYVLDDQGFRVITDDQTWVNEVGRRLGIDEETLKNHVLARAGAAVRRWSLHYQRLIAIS